MSNNRNDILKVIGLVSMTFDHIGMLLFPHILWFRIVGRIAFPLFAYHIAIGVRHTKSIAKYALRVLMFACLTQPIFIFVVGSGMNIMFDLFFGIVVLWLLRQNKRQYTYLVLALTLVWELWSKGYGGYGTACIVVFYYMKEDAKLASMAFIAISIVAAFFSTEYVQGFAVLALPFILLKVDFRAKMPKYFFYVYYPVHLLIIYFVGIELL